jgi:phthalate 4,5-cis-dihydrodiol dehydrogenase
MSSVQPLRLGVAGLGRAFMLMLPTLAAHPRVQLVAACDPRSEARDRFERDFGGTSHATLDALCASPAIDAIYIATPNEMHAAHVALAARHGKHVLLEKPMAVTLAECQAMIDATRAAGVTLVIGHSHSFDAPFVRAREIVAQGRYGRVGMITALNFTDFLYRPRRPEELDTAKGGGVVFSQGAHQVDVVRLLGGGLVDQVHAHTGAWDRARPTEGAYNAQMTFADGSFASLTYSGYAHFDSDEFTGWIGETGHPKDRSRYGAARAALRGERDASGELALKTRRAYGSAEVAAAAPVAHHQFGLVLVSCEGADLRPLPNGVMIYDDERAWLDELPPPTVPRAEVIDEWCDAIAGTAPAVHTGEWAMATLEACLAIVQSARTGHAVTLRHQVGVPA